ncbi:MAG TPA: acyloxyacyl hydrolase [Daejeonella sp.]|nr:acyloxyacyl hydrolase [Daejeonella sp.]
MKKTWRTKLKLHKCIFVGLFVFPFLVNGQSNSGFLLDGKAVIGSHALGADMLQNNLYGIDVSWQKDISQKEDAWRKLSNAQSSGLSFVFRNLNKGYQDTSVNSLGQSYGLAAQIEFRLFKLGNTSVSFTPAMGLGYITKTYFTDHRNRVIGSHLNQLIKADLNAVIPLSTNMNLLAGAGFLHYSNGGFQIPNGGLNTLNLFTGLRFGKSWVKPNISQSKYRPIRKNSIEVAAGIGRRGIYQQRNGLYKSGMYGGYNYYINDLLRAKAGIDAVYYYTPFNPDPEKALQTFQYYGTSYSRWRAGISIGPEINLGRFGVNAQVGKYIYYNRYHQEINWYWTATFTYALTPHMGVQGRTYFHKAQADFINYGLCFKI